MDLTPRQSEFADAALRVLAAGGMASVTFRSVAAEAGMSPGAVQKAFPSKDVMQHAMFHRMRERASAPAMGEPGRPDLRRWLVDLMMVVLPLDDARRAAELQASGFAERAAYDSSIGGAIAASDRELTARIALLVRRGMAEGEVADVDPDMVARAWFALGEGLSTQLLYDPRPEDDVRAFVGFVVDRLLGPDPRGTGFEMIR
ncbi:MAG TPA: TetR/AcrR family transcriptional regulator [Actinomycetaceae bacterium]|nr:TetR/AcrR family transcriptional regulator [Actinomycetaceae bacterium]